MKLATPSVALAAKLLKVRRERGTVQVHILIVWELEDP